MSAGEITPQSLQFANAINEVAQGEDVRGPVERLKEARRIVWSMCADGRPPRMSIPAEDTDEDVFIVDTITATIALLESLSAKLAEREADVARLKAHAEAMAEGIESSHLEIEQEALAAYRADFPEGK